MYSRVSSMLRGSGRMIQRAATTTGSLPLSKSLLGTLLKRVSVSKRKVASFLAGTRYQGPDSLKPPYKSSGEANRGQVIPRQPVVAGCDAPEVLQPVECLSMRQRNL